MPKVELIVNLKELFVINHILQLSNSIPVAKLYVHLDLALIVWTKMAQIDILEWQVNTESVYLVTS